MISTIFSLKQLSKNTFFYGISGVLSQLIGFFLIPVYTRVLSPADYGTMALIGTTTTILGIIFGMGFNGFIMRSYNDYKDVNERKDFVGSLVLFQLAATFIITMVVCLYSKQLSAILLNDSTFSKYLIIAVAGLWISLASIVPTSCMQLRNEASTVMILSISMTLVGTIIPLILVVKLKLGVMGVFLGTASGQLLSTLIMSVFLIREMNFKIKWVYVSAALAFGLPLIPHLLSHWTMNYIDRLMLQRYTSTAEVGLYSVGYNFGMIMLFIVGTINTAWSPFFYNINSSNDEKTAKAQIARLTTYWFMVCGFCCLCLCVLGPTLLQVMAAKNFEKASAVIPVIAITFFIHGMYFMSVNSIFLKKKTKILPFVSGISAAINIGLNIILIPKYGMMGAAYATLISFTALFIMVYAYSRTIYKVEYEYSRFLIFLGILVISAASVFYVPVVNLFTQLIIKGAILSLIAGTLSYCFCLTKNERKKAFSIITFRVNHI